VPASDADGAKKATEEARARRAALVPVAPAVAAEPVAPVEAGPGEAKPEAPAPGWRQPIDVGDVSRRTRRQQSASKPR
jgi:hypothetical protein